MKTTFSILMLTFLPTISAADTIVLQASNPNGIVPRGMHSIDLRLDVNAAGNVVGGTGQLVSGDKRGTVVWVSGRAPTVDEIDLYFEGCISSEPAPLGCPNGFDAFVRDWPNPYLEISGGVGLNTAHNALFAALSVQSGRPDIEHMSAGMGMHFMNLDALVIDPLVGDANLDGRFDSSDLVQVFMAGQYEDSSIQNSGWGSGDWNGDLEFDTGDLVDAFAMGGYELPSSSKAVSEPAGASLLWLALIPLLAVGRKVVPL